MVGHDAGLLDTDQEVQQIHEGPWEVVMDKVRAAGHLGKARDDGERHAGGSDLQIQTRAVQTVLAHVRRGRNRVARQGQHVNFETQSARTPGQCVHHLLRAAGTIENGSLEKVEDSHNIDTKPVRQNCRLTKFVI